MKLERNPLAIDPSRAHSLHASSFSRVLAMLQRVQASAAKQTLQIERAALSPPSTQADIDFLFRQLDQAAAAAQINGAPALDGRYAADSKTASMWIATGIAGNQRERVTIPHLGAVPVRQSGLKPGMNGRAAAQALASAAERFHFAEAQLESYQTRFGFTRTMSDAFGRGPGFTRAELLRRPIAGEKALTRRLLAVLETVRLITNRLVKRFQGVGTLKTNGEKIGAQAEVSQLVDEVDRIASQSEFNHMRFLLGDFAETSRSSSMWFSFPGLKEDRKRIFIPTMTARALGMRYPDGEVVTISQSKRALASVRSALDKIEKQRREMEALLALLEKSREIADPELPAG